MKMLAWAFCALASWGTALGARAADVFSVPLVDGQTWSFLQSGTVVDSNGASSSWGPERLDVQVRAVDAQVLGHHADWLIVEPGSSYAGNYLAQTAAGIFRVSEGNPATDAVYRYYDDPQPWLYLAQPLEIGQPVTFSGRRNGAWAVPGGGTEAWSGTWAETITNLGAASVTTPLGTFSALKLQAEGVTTVDTRALFPAATGRETWNELRWFVPGLGYVKIEGSGLDETDFDGDRVVDRWRRETQVMVAVPEPAAAWTMMLGLAVAFGIRKRMPVRPGS